MKITSFRFPATSHFTFCKLGNQIFYLYISKPFRGHVRLNTSPSLGSFDNGGPVKLSTYYNGVNRVVICPLAVNSLNGIKFLMQPT